MTSGPESDFESEPRVYQEHLRIDVDEISPRVRERVKKVFGTQKKFARAFSQVVKDIGEGSCYQFINMVLTGGGVAMRISLTNPRRRVVSLRRNLERIALLYQLAEFTPDDPVVLATRKINPWFLYPLQGQGAEEVSCRVRVNLPPGFAPLNSEQMGALERLAIEYSRSNQERKE